MTTSLDRALQRLVEKFPPKHLDRKTMRPYEREQQRTNAAPIVTPYGSREPVGGTVNWKKQDSIPVGQVDSSLWGPPPVRGVAVANKNKNNKGKKK
jgi:hypothetical protein